MGVHSENLDFVLGFEISNYVIIRDADKKTESSGWWWMKLDYHFTYYKMKAENLWQKRKKGRKKENKENKKEKMRKERRKEGRIFENHEPWLSYFISSVRLFFVSNNYSQNSLRIMNP